MADLVETTTNIVRPTEPVWDVVPMTRTYDSAVEDQGDWRVEALIVCVEGDLTSDGLTPSVTIMYYMGVFYPVQTDSRSIRDSICRGAFASAAKLAGGPVLTTDAQLSDTLKQSGTTTFQSKFGFSYGSIPPESWQAEGVSSGYVKSNAQLMYLPMLNPGQEYLSTFIEQGLFSGLDVPDQSIKREATNDLTTDFQRVLSGSAQGSWATSSIDRL